MSLTLVPAEFTLVKFDVDEIRGIFADAVAATGFPPDVAVTIEVDEVLPHPLTASAVDVTADGVRLWFTGGCFESPQRQTGLSVENTSCEIAAALFRAKDRLDGGFENAPVDDELDERARNIWDAYADARVARLGYPVRVQRRRYTFRLYCGFNDVADAEFERIWAGAPLTWDEVTALSDTLAAADTRPTRKKTIRRESLRVPSA
ncbi:MAG: hypothetical protein ACXVJ7_12180 [Acidimicrobiia bacterium]